ncbi:MAG: nucleotidyltransferase domain-containing protein [Deltaproteobacteria bacterium]|nr:nucleotidyltransferase domain-containing protein [Deltaproteobacteria bacterium]
MPSVLSIAGENLLVDERALDRRVYLFGSRARGDARDDSDVDLAFVRGSSPAAWPEFVNAAREQAPILLDLELVDSSCAVPELRERIVREGRLLRG